MQMTVIWETIENISEGSYNLYKDFELNVDVDELVAMKISQKTQSIKK